jgi:hypothetical protein
MSIDWDTLVIGPLQGVFGEPVTYTPAVGSPFPITGVFDNAYKDLTMSEYAPDVATLYPALGVRLVEFPVPPLQGDQLTITRTGKTYTVRLPRPDSHGGALLILNYLSG